MSTLADLFSKERSAAAATTARIDPERTSARLAGVVGAPRANAAHPAADTAALVALVGERMRAASLTNRSAAVAPPKRIRRGKSGRDWLSITLAVLAVVAVLAAAGVTAMVLSSASPAAGAMHTLAQSEAVLVDDIQAIGSELSGIETQAGKGRDQAEALKDSLSAMADASDTEPLAAVEKARAAYLKGLNALVVPTVPEPYQRPAVDQESLASVGEAIDAVNARVLALEPVAADVDAAQARLDALDEKFAAALAKFVVTVPASAETVLFENPDALASYRDDVMIAADAVASASLLTSDGTDALADYVAAVEALRDDQARAAAEIAYQQELERQQQEAGSGGASGGATTDPDPEPTEEPTPEPTEEPEPEPEPVD